MAEPNDNDRADADRFLGRYGEEPRKWERADLVAFIAELRERHQQGAPCPPHDWIYGECRNCGRFKEDVEPNT